MFSLKLLTTFTLFTLTFPISIAENPAVLEQATINPAAEVVSVKVEPQQFKVSAYVEETKLSRESYTATTIEEVHAIEAEREAQRVAEERARLQEEAKQRVSSVAGWVAISQENPTCSGNFCWPLTSFTYDPENNGFHTASRPNHDGFDMLAPGGTPIYAVTGGTVIVSTESYSAYGAAIVIQSVVDGQTVTMTYGHMTYGTRQVEVGDTVSAGQVIGGVGSTGRSTANHLHLEIRLNNALVDPQPWLVAHAG